MSECRLVVKVVPGTKRWEWVLYGSNKRRWEESRRVYAKRRGATLAAEHVLAAMKSVKRVEVEKP